MKKVLTLILCIVLLVGIFIIVSFFIYKEGDKLFRESNNIKGVGFDPESIVTSDGAKAKVSSSGRILSFETPSFYEVGNSATVLFKIKNNSKNQVTLGTPALSCFFVDEDLKFLAIIPASNLDSAVIGPDSISEESSVVVRQVKKHKSTSDENIKFQCALNVAIQE